MTIQAAISAKYIVFLYQGSNAEDEEPEEEPEDGREEEPDPDPGELVLGL